MPAGSRTADFDFDLPPELIAQTPAERRDESRMLVLDRAGGTVAHRKFTDLPEYLSAGDALVLNSSKVIRARLLGTRDSGAPAEVMLIKPLGDGRYEAMVHPGGKLKPGRRVSVSPQLEVEIQEITERRTR
ncbi:MAG: S-adenosylmethionine:tRNA ribosyltransferase-isomerase, partial [Gemmatimonadaceae bacterium]